MHQLFKNNKNGKDGTKLQSTKILKCNLNSYWKFVRKECSREVLLGSVKMRSFEVSYKILNSWGH